MASLIIEKPAAVDPVTLDEMKNFLRVSITDDDALIRSLIKGATRRVETFTDRSFVAKGFRQGLDSFPYFVDTVMSQMAFPPSYYSLPRYSTTLWNYSQMIKLFRPPLISVERISFIWSTDQQWHDLVPAPPLWYPGTAYTVGNKVMDNNANVQRCTTAGTSAANPPTWNKTVTGTTTEVNPDPEGEGTGPVVWTNDGPLPAQPTSPGFPPQWQFGPFIVDNSSEPARIFPGPPGGFWPQALYVPNAVQIHFTAGFSADASGVPDTIKTAIKMLVNNWYENREAAMPVALREIPNQIQDLLWDYKVIDYQPTRG